MVGRASAASSSSAPAPAAGAADAKQQEALELCKNIRKRLAGLADGAPVSDPAAFLQKLRQQRGVLDKKARRRSLRSLKRVPASADGNDPTTGAPSLGNGKGITNSAHGWRCWSMPASRPGASTATRRES